MPAYLFIDHSDWLEKVAIDAENLLLGRLPENDLEISDTKVSREHCRITQENGAYTIKDLDSSNGTFVNGERIDSKTLEEGDRILIGETMLHFSKQEEGPSTLRAGAEDVHNEATTFVKGVEELPEDYRVNVEESIEKGLILHDDARRGSDYRLRKTDDDKGGVNKFVLLYQLGKTLNRKADLQEALEVTVKTIRDVIDPKRCVILERNRDEETLDPRIAWERERGFVDDDLHISYSITERVFKKKVSLISTDASEDPRFQGEKSIADYNIQSAMCVPLWEEDEVFGVIYVDDEMEKEAFDDEDLDLLSAISNQVAIRIKQKVLFDKLKREAVIRKNFERFHSPGVTEDILRKSEEGKELPQELKEGELSVLFVDIVRFTKQAQKVSSREVADLLQRFYNYMSSKIFDYDGGVNKYMGDNVMALFGAPIEREDHAIQAVNCAKDMISSLDEAQIDGMEPYKVRIGVNSGQVVHGYVGSSEVKEFTVIGKAVNHAAKLEEIGEPNSIFIGRRTAELVKDEIEVKKLNEESFSDFVKEASPYSVPVSPPEYERRETEEKQERSSDGNKSGDDTDIPGE